MSTQGGDGVITAVARVQRPEDTVLTISLSMTAGEWKRLVASTDTDYPGWVVRRAIDKALASFSATHEGVVEYEHP